LFGGVIWLFLVVFCCFLSLFVVFGYFGVVKIRVWFFGFCLLLWVEDGV
jgi:hypothetical protein